MHKDRIVKTKFKIRYENDIIGDEVFERSLIRLGVSDTLYADNYGNICLKGKNPNMVSLDGYDSFKIVDDIESDSLSVKLNKDLIIKSLEFLDQHTTESNIKSLWGLPKE